MAIDKLTLGAAKSYVNNLIEGGGGIIKGKNCTISSITEILNESEVAIGKRVVFTWYLDNGVQQTSQLDIMYTDITGPSGADGSDGVGIYSITFKEQDAQGNNVYTVTLTNNSTYDIIAPRGPYGELVDRTFNVSVADWSANSGATSTDYPYIAEIATTIYNNNSKPIWQMNGAGLIPTSTERDDINLVLEAIFNSTGITLYATDIPSGALVLEVKGE